MCRIKIGFVLHYSNKLINQSVNIDMPSYKCNRTLIDQNHFSANSKFVKGYLSHYIKLVGLLTHNDIDFGIIK